MKKGLILLNAYTAGKGEAQAKRLKDEFEKLFIAIDIKANNFFAASIGEREIELNVKGYDFCIYLDKDKYILKMLEKSGVKVFNSYRAICDCDDKFITHIRLSGSGLNMPKSYSGLLCYTKDIKINEQSADYIIEKLNLPLIVKKSYGSLGSGVFLAKTKGELINLMDKLKCEPHFFQEFIKESSGKDTRVIVIGKKAVAAMRRENKSDFRSNLELGALGTPLAITKNLRHCAEKAAKILNLDYCGVDILTDSSGKHYVCEVNSNAYFSGIEKVTGINVAEIYAKHIASKL